MTEVQSQHSSVLKDSVKVSIVMATTGRRAITRRAIRSLLEQDSPPGEYELILVLDGCEEPEWCATERRNARCHFLAVPQPRRGQAASINAGLRLASGELALFMDDDILCPQELLSHHVAAHSRHPGHLAFGPILTSEESSPGLATQWIRNRNDSGFHQLTLQHATPETASQGWCFSFANPNTSAPRNLLLSAGALDESFWRFNDTEFGFRLWKHGLRFIYLPDAAVSHVVEESIAELVRKHACEEGHAEVRLCRKHSEYRQFTVLGGLSCERTARIARRRLLISVCKLAEAILAPVTSMANAFRRVPFLRRAGLRLISIRFMAHFFRGAIDECGSWKAFQREFAQRLPVLAYHRVGQPQPREWHALTLSTQRLESHLRWLKHTGWHSITSAQWAAWLEFGSPLPEKPILLTFDDGFADNVANAFPLLLRYGLGALTAVVTTRIGDRNRWDSEAGLPEFQLMSAADIRTWTARGMEFASHSRSHSHLPKLSESELAMEIAVSRSELATVAGVEIDNFVFPYGEYDDRVCKAVAHHYRLAFTLDGGLNGLGAPLRMRRILVSRSDTPLDLWFYTIFGWSPLKALRRKLTLKA